MFSCSSEKMMPFYTYTLTFLHHISTPHPEFPTTHKLRGQDICLLKYLSWYWRYLVACFLMYHLFHFTSALAGNKISNRKNSEIGKIWCVPKVRTEFTNGDFFFWILLYQVLLVLRLPKCMSLTRVQITVCSSDKCWCLCGQMAHSALNKIVVFLTSLSLKLSWVGINCIGLYVHVFHLEAAYINSKVLHFYVLAPHR